MSFPSTPPFALTKPFFPEKKQQALVPSPLFGHAGCPPGAHRHDKVRSAINKVSQEVVQSQQGQKLKSSVESAQYAAGLKSSFLKASHFLKEFFHNLYTSADAGISPKKIFQSCKNKLGEFKDWFQEAGRIMWDDAKSSVSYLGKSFSSSRKK